MVPVALVILNNGSEAFFNQGYTYRKMLLKLKEMIGAVAMVTMHTVSQFLCTRVQSSQQAVCKQIALHAFQQRSECAAIYKARSKL